MLRLPPFGHGQRIGLFGGSFNPAHRGHYMVALYAMKRLQLDWVWWLVSPQNPLKDPSETGEYGKRLAYTRRVARHPRFIVTDLEEQIHTRYTAQTLEALKGAFTRGHFVWIMGADSLANLHRWHHWTDIMESLPIAVLARPGVSAVIVGARNRAHLGANLRIASLTLGADDLAAIEAVLRRSQDLPGDVYALERDTAGRHGSIMKYNLNSEGKEKA